jgi:hypothetical protein
MAVSINDSSVKGIETLIHSSTTFWEEAAKDRRERKKEWSLELPF